jgi:hypothetical protein
MPLTPFLHRMREPASLDRLTRRPEPSLLLIYGRRRVGKSSLARHWAAKTGWPVFYWESPRSTAENARASLLREALPVERRTHCGGPLPPIGWRSSAQCVGSSAINPR